MSIDPNIDEEVLESKKSTGGGDLASLYPNPDYYGSNNINYAAVGASRTSLSTGGSVESSNLEDTTSIASQYPLNQVTMSRTGHIKEIDDTPGNSRMLWRHANKRTGVEFMADGSVKVVTSKNTINITAEDQTVVVEGNGTLIYNGNLDLKVNGDYNIECNNYNLTTKGNKKEVISKSSRTKVAGNVGVEVVGSMNTVATGFVNNTYLNGYTANVKGTFSNNVNGIANFFSSGSTNLTSEGTLSTAGENMNITANDLTIMGGTGTIGGTGMLFSGKGAVYEEGVTAPTFHGDLKGTAVTSTVTQSQTYGEAATGSAGSITDTPQPTIDKPDASFVEAVLEPDNNTVIGKRQVRIDTGDFIRDAVNNSKSTGGLSTQPLTTAVVRSRLRNPLNRDNDVFIQNGIANGQICMSYNEEAPAAIGRTSAFEAPKELGPNAGQDAYIPIVRTSKTTTVVDREYNPERLVEVGTITPKTLLADGVPMSRFLGGDDPVSIEGLSEKKKLDIARHYYLHARIMKSVAEDINELADYRLVVTEGLYRKAPGETVTPGSVADMRSKGRAVVYSLIGPDGSHATEMLYDLAMFWKDTILYDRMVLDYDTISCDGLTGRIIITLPEITETWTAVYVRNIDTLYNSYPLTQNELVEVLGMSAEGAQFLDEDQYSVMAATSTFPHHLMNQTLNTVAVGYDGTNGKLDPSTLVMISPAIRGQTFGSGPLLLTREYAARWESMKKAAALDGITLIPSSAYRSFTYQDLAYKEHKAVNPNYVIARPGRSNHGLGEAVDIRNATGKGDPVWQWLRDNGGRFGFLQSDRLTARDPVHWSRTGG